MKTNQPAAAPAQGQHTPGPWLVYGRAGHYLDPSGWTIERPQTGAVGSNITSQKIATAHDAANPGEAEANARLIAAAPALAEALRECLPFFSDAHCVRSVKWTSARDKARAALALAEG